MNRLIDIGVKVIVIIILYLGFQSMKWSMGFENTVFVGICIIISELWDRIQIQNKEDE